MLKAIILIHRNLSYCAFLVHIHSCNQKQTNLSLWIADTIFLFFPK